MKTIQITVDERPLKVMSRAPLHCRSGLEDAEGRASTRAGTLLRTRAYRDRGCRAQRRDREMARIFNDPKRTNALVILARIRSSGLLTEDEFATLSPETRNAIELMLGAE